MKRKIGFIFLVFLSLFFLFSCGDKNNQIEFTEEYFEKKLVILKKGEIYKIDTEKLFTNKFNFEIEEYSLHLGNYNATSEIDNKPIAGDEIIFEDKKSDFKLYCFSEFKECLDLKDNIITAKDLGRMSVSIIIQFKNGTTKNNSNRICSQILEVVVTDNTYSNFTKINNVNDFQKMHNSKDLFILNQSLEFNVGTELFEGNLEFFGIFINPYNYHCNLSFSKYGFLFETLLNAYIDNFIFDNIFLGNSSFAREVNHCVLSNLNIKNLEPSLEVDFTEIWLIDRCLGTTLKNIEIHIEKNIKAKNFSILKSMDSTVFIKNLILHTNSNSISNICIAAYALSRLLTYSSSFLSEEVVKDAFEIYNVLFLNTANQKVFCSFQYNNYNKLHPFGKDKLFYSAGFEIGDDSFVNKTMEEIVSGENLFSSSEFKFEKGKLPTLFY